MIINGKLRDFACNVIAKGQITLGDVRRLQRGYLAGGITNREELEILISVNAKIVRADKAWAQWLISVVADFVTKREACEHPFDDAARKSVEHLLAASATNLGLRIARQIRRRLRATPPAGKGVQACEIQQAVHDPDDCSLRNDPPCSGRARRNVRSKMIPRTMTLASAAHRWCLPIQRSDLINFQSSRISLVLAPCL